MTAEQIADKRLALQSLVKCLRCYGKFQSATVSFNGSLKASHVGDRMVPSGPFVAVYSDPEEAYEVGEELQRDLSPAEIMAIEVLLGDGLAGAALADYLQEQGLCPVDEAQKQARNDLLNSLRESGCLNERYYKRFAYL